MTLGEVVREELCVRVGVGGEKQEGWVEYPGELLLRYRKFVAPTKTLESTENTRAFLVFTARPLFKLLDLLRTTARNPRLALRGTTISMPAQSHIFLSK